MIGTDAFGNRHLHPYPITSTTVGRTYRELPQVAGDTFRGRNRAALAGEWNIPKDNANGVLRRKHSPLWRKKPRTAFGRRNIRDAAAMINLPNAVLYLGG